MGLMNLFKTKLPSPLNNNQPTNPMAPNPMGQQSINGMAPQPPAGGGIVSQALAMRPKINGMMGGMGAGQSVLQNALNARKSLKTLPGINKLPGQF